MAKKYLDLEGLKHFSLKFKEYVNTKLGQLDFKPNDFIVKMSYSMGNEGATYSVDKTNAEIYQAYQEGKTVRLYNVLTSVYYDLEGICTETNAVFAYSSISSMSSTDIRINNDELTVYPKKYYVPGEFNYGCIKANPVDETYTVPVKFNSEDGKTYVPTYPVGIPVGGTTGQVLAKKSDTDNDVEWTTVTGGSGGSEIFWVEFSGDESSGFTSNKTYTEVFNAVKNNYIVLGKKDASDIFQLSLASFQSYAFSRIDCTTSPDYMYLETITVGRVGVTHKKQPMEFKDLKGSGMIMENENSQYTIINDFSYEDVAPNKFIIDVQSYDIYKMIGTNMETEVYIFAAISIENDNITIKELSFSTNNEITVSVKTVPLSNGTERITKTSSDTNVTIEPNKLYVWPEISSLTITLAAPTNNNIANEYHFFFESGATPTNLTLNDVLSDTYTIEANMKYEVSILEGIARIKGFAKSES